MKVIRPLLRVGIGGGAVYLVINQKLVSDNQKESIEATKTIANAVPGLNPYLEKIPHIMSKQELTGYWNSGVKITISTLAELPENSKEAFSRGLDYATEEFKKLLQNTGK